MELVVIKHDVYVLYVLLFLMLLSIDLLFLHANIENWLEP